ncbi:SDR family NAD(P)-dependent oxidoreductase [Vibrio agarivorans]|uniref:SDR family NAD(P)-dependent oxidoreductase n=1 Tax=Vibrio agarivorans TaxID=153622 RepID=A0ABT7XYQ7_9VIBR|nr:SDR family NAD(P)-dependent oxidoreductase [Vibrio agarivorans]MDN2480906.1 SDR family NAD(P)-dependent oxidoreductase [Vibrio agarivorans]
MNVLIVGGVGGIGQALVTLFNDVGYNVFATYHRTPPSTSNGVWFKCDVTDEDSIVKLAEALPSLDVVINCVGILHTCNAIPEKTIQSFDVDFFKHNIETNTLPTLLLAKHLQTHLKSKHTTYFVALSAKVGSIEDNHLGGWISYRASKAALNMSIKTIAIEWRAKLPRCCVIAFHPGTIDTPLSAPFQPRIPSHQLHQPEWLASKLHQLLNKLEHSDTGQLIDYNGTKLPW